MNSHAEGESGQLPTDDEFSELCATFVEAWYTFSINESAVQFANELSEGIPSIVACRDLYARNEAIDNIKVGITDIEDNSIFAAACKYVEIVERRKNDPDYKSGLQSGIIGIDTRTGGFEGGDLIGICGFAGKGKTTITHQIVSCIAKQEKVVEYSLEESPLNLGAKTLSANTGVSTIDMKHGQISDEDLQALKNSLSIIANIKLSVIDNIFHIDELERSIILQVKKNGAKCIVIDNLTIIQHNQKGNRDDNETRISYRLKALAKKLNIVIFVLIHQNKDSTGRGDRRPVTTDVKFAGGAVAFDIVIFPYTAKENENEHELNIETSAEITKNRGGGMTGTVPLIFAKNWGLYCEYYEDDNGVKHPILPKQPKRIETTEVNAKPSNIITQRGNVTDIPF
jgi:replicative DNA helicase